MDWSAKLVEGRGQELAESFLNAARNGDWRAAEALMSRIYGKPEAAVVAQVPANPVTDVIRSLSLAEKLELLQSLQRGKPVELPIIQGSSTTNNELERCATVDTIRAIRAILR